MRTAAETEVRRPSAVRCSPSCSRRRRRPPSWSSCSTGGTPGAGLRVGRPDRLGHAALVRLPAADRACAPGRTVARPFGLILAVTTVFAVGRLIVPRQVPPLPGLLGFVILSALCAAVVWLLYRSSALAGHLVRHRPRLVIDRAGISWRETPPRRPQASAWLLTSRVAAFTYSPLMLVPALVAGGSILDGRLTAVPAVLFWFGAGITASYAVLFCTAFLMRGKDWARGLLVVVTVAVLAVDLPLCWWLLGVDGLVRDGAPGGRGPAHPLRPPPRRPHPRRPHPDLTRARLSRSWSCGA
ncbi:hypothetical protein NKG94_29715 [Micromonospora sp. M12]